MQSEAEPRALHAAIIMDGNGRWATGRGLPRIAGHRRGVEAIRRTAEACPDLGIGTLTLYAFSADNWQRPADEVGGLMRLLRSYLRNETQRLARTGTPISSSTTKVPNNIAMPISALLRPGSGAAHATACTRQRSPSAHRRSTAAGS